MFLIKNFVKPRKSKISSLPVGRQGSLISSIASFFSIHFITKICYNHLIYPNLMGPLDLLRHPLILTGITVPDFLRWYFWKRPCFIAKTYVAYLRAMVEIFSFVFLLRTLFSPWKQITSSPAKSILHFSEWGQALTLNIVSRTIGFLFRTIMLCIGTVVTLILTIVYALYFVAWLLFPILFFVGLFFLLNL